jgi:demethylmenaquinone methyltransferase/2-methoxy-6-polyprenyl-1,4-benzoquinol methylase
VKKQEDAMTNESSLEYEPGVLRVLQSKSEREAYYNKIAKVYDLLAEHSERAMREAGLAKLAATQGEHILEIGFGTGHCLVDLAKTVGPTGKVFGIDISENMVSIARELMEKEQFMDRVEVRRGDAEALPYSANCMDGIFMSFTLELFDTPEIPGVLAQCKRVLRPGGRIVVVGVSKEGKQGVIIKAFEWTHRHFPNLMDCRPIDIARALEAAGFIIQDTAIDHMWVPVEIVLAVKP